MEDRLRQLEQRMEHLHERQANILAIVHAVREDQLRRSPSPLSPPTHTDRLAALDPVRMALVGFLLAAAARLLGIDPSKLWPGS